ncbi:hypothetical protein CLOACE_12620 [Clostridium acetireducens DSM 10703]|jgi:predicted transcriptional regulator|uniref:DUF4364 domain-containing protein n=1 Tax=Clostridium acetireducens DSM 10703 TaxID=1121290 RepID=A0A1E8EZ22_9CLOT|nr:DUF4364 family protein [Clostridium acetireducens]OFI06119.1 hypothetical protein CLOACE_12620 [Clostridium acetireducens DSM 10703]
MFEDTLELAENKLLLLYIFNKINFAISNNQITQIILENNFINYFTLQQYISELVSSNFLKYIEKDGKHRLIITDKGLKVLNLFKNRISNQKKYLIDEYLKNHLNNIKQEVTITADYTIEHKNNFIVNLKAVENDCILIDLKLNVGSNDQAKKLCAKWKKHSTEIYSKIIKAFID